MKQRSLAGYCAIGVCVIAFVCVTVAFCTPSWLVCYYRTTGIKLNQLGLWSHCFRILAQADDEFLRRFFVGCSWIYDTPFTNVDDETRGLSRTGFMVVTQVFFTICFVCILATLFTVLHNLCWGPERTSHIPLINSVGALLTVAGVCGAIAVIVFACCGNNDDWMPGQHNNFFGWAFGMAVVGVVAAFVSATLFFVEDKIQHKKMLPI